MIEISKQYTFDSAHRLYRPEWSDEENLENFGKCSRLHGHTYILTVTIAGQVDIPTGMILNYEDLDEIVKPVLASKLDHFYLNDMFSGLTTAENMVLQIARWIASEMVEDLGDDARMVWLREVKLQETPKTSATWRADA